MFVKQLFADINFLSFYQNFIKINFHKMFIYYKKISNTYDNINLIVIGTYVYLMSVIY